MSKVRVFVVEDEGIVAMDLFGTLNRLGYELAGNTARGEEALDLVKKVRPDVILMDIRLAGTMDGIEAARQIRSEVQVPVIFLTAYSDAPTLARARTVEPYGYIMKPFDDVSVRTAVELAFFRRQAESERELLEKTKLENEKLKELNELRRRFVSMAAHELNTPLTPIRINLHLLAETLRDRMTGKERQQLESLDRNFLRLSALVKDLLDAARLQSGRMVLKLQRTDVARLATTLAATYSDRFERQGLLFKLTAPEEAWAEVDADRVIQILANILDNASKFTPAGGHIGLAVNQDAQTVRIEVSDTGPGLNDDQLKVLFQPFTMVQDAAVQGQNSGLGLYISRGIAESHGGTLVCKSEGKGRGASFVLSLPKVAASQD